MFCRVFIPLVVLVLGLSACGGVYRTASDYPAQASFALREADSGPEVLPMLERFYGAPIGQWATVEKEASALLRRYPHSAELHEIAGYAAVLHADAHGRWLHFLAAAADLRSPHTELYLNEAFAEALTVSEANASIDFLEVLSRKHPRSSVRNDAARHLVDLYQRLGRDDDAEDAARRADFIRDFRMIGPFDDDQGKGFLTPYEPENKVDFSAPARGLRTEVRWRRAKVERDGLVALGNQIWPYAGTLGYLVTHVFVPKATSGELRLSTSKSVKAWVNDALVTQEEHVSSEATDNVVVPVALKAGWNRLLIKSANPEGYWALGARVTQVGGNPIAGLRVSSSTKAYVPVPSAGAPATADPIKSTVRPATRQNFLRSRAWMLLGYSGKALTPVQSYLGLAGDNPVAMYFGAVVDAANEQSGEAIDLYDKGVEGLGDAGTAFLRRRGLYYQSKERWDRAIGDYRRAMAHNADSLLVRMDYADLLGDRGWQVERCKGLTETHGRWPDSGWALRELSDCLNDRGYGPEAEAKIHESLALEPGHVFALGVAADYAERRQDYDGAIDLRKRIIALRPTNVDAFVELGDVQRTAGKRDAAAASYRAAMSINPTWPRPRQRLGLMAQEDGNEKLAAQLWTEAIVLDPSDKQLAEHLEFLRPGNSDDFNPYGPTLDDIDAAIARSSSLKIYPGAHSIVLLDDEVRIVGSDGSSRMLVTSVSQVVTTDGRDELLKQHVPSSARVLSAFAQTKDGKRQQASSIRDGEIRFRGLEIGSTTVVQFVYHERAGGFLPNHFVADWSFQGRDQQFEHSRWVMLLPTNRPLSLALRGDVKHTIEKKGDYVVHTFLAEHVPPLNQEPAMGSLSDILWRADVSTVPNWDEYVAWERALLSDVFERSDKLHALALKITDGAKTPHDKLDHLFAYVAQEIRYQQDYENTIAGVKPHSAATVLERGYGDCKDNATLLILLAREVNVKVWIAFVRTRDAGQVVRDVPNQQFNHAIAYVPPQTGIETGYFIDSTTDGLDVGNLRSDDQGTQSLVIDPENGKYEFIAIPFAESDKEEVTLTTDVRLQGKDKMEATVEMVVRGGMASQIRRTIRNAADADRLYNRIANLYFPGATVKTSAVENGDDIWKRLTLKLELDASSSIQLQGGAYRLPLVSPLGLESTSQLTTRKTPLRLGAPETISATARYHLPAGAKVQTKPDNMRVEHPCFSAKRSFKVSGQVVDVTYSFTRSCTDVSVADYASYRAAAQKAANQLKGDIVVNIK